ncbi:E3 ubiquitin-protein ligase FANCL-like [Sycon ciliatum]|uniref:E3 ubiquitin-protein ligase FANCL-like n=1 Tax=Sycon ciliatum TaxID=27933 RepID=UPI0020AE9564|eukprot:scpid55626/ scgid2750/ E3 ubiquitin-protein ligase FANCL; Fanconi anemia group L protein; Fanconi anemia-associated polypeptide of 43 kDa
MMDDVGSIFPTLLPVDSKFKIYEGFINVKEDTFHVRIELPAGYQPGVSTLDGTILDGDHRLSLLLADCVDVISQRLSLSNTLSAFLVEFKHIVEHCLATSNTASEQALALPPKFFSKIVEEIGVIGWERLTFVDPSFSSLQLSAQDDAQRTHPITVHLHSNYPISAPRCTVDLPVAFDLRWSSKGGCLQEVYDQFTQALKLYQDFWNLMDEIDSNVWVLEPEKPNRSALLRRIAISSTASVQIEVDPVKPRSLPIMQLLGAAQAVAPLKEHLNRNLDQWDLYQSILDNLTVLLGVEFPSKATTKEEELFVACGICYTYRLNNATPVEACAYERCKQPFHQLCLYEWLRTLSTSRVSYNVIFGTCPYCSQPISVKTAS